MIETVQHLRVVERLEVSQKHVNYLSSLDELIKLHRLFHLGVDEVFEFFGTISTVVDHKQHSSSQLHVQSNKTPVFRICKLL